MKFSLFWTTVIKLDGMTLTTKSLDVTSCITYNRGYDFSIYTEKPMDWELNLNIWLVKNLKFIPLVYRLT